MLFVTSGKNVVACEAVVCLAWQRTRQPVRKAAGNACGLTGESPPVQW